MWSLDSTVAAESIAKLEEIAAASESRRTFGLIVLSAFSAAALALASLGLDGVIAGKVVERTGETGLRSALGATPGKNVASSCAKG